MSLRKMMSLGFLALLLCVATAQINNPTSSSGTVTVVSSGNLTSTALVTGGGSQALQTPSATSTLSSAGALSLAAGGSIGSADTGTPKFTFGANAITANSTVHGVSDTSYDTLGFQIGSYGIGISSNSAGISVGGTGSNPIIVFRNGVAALPSGGSFGWSNGADAGTGFDTALNRISAGVVGVAVTSSGAAGTIEAASTILTDPGPFGSALTYASAACETAFAPTTLSTGATTTTTGLNCLPANSFIDAVVARVTTTITSACTGWELGDGTTAARFSSNNTTLTAGTTTDAAHIGTFITTGINSATTGVWQASAHSITVTCATGNPGAGAIRIIVYYHTWTAPTS